ncbi:MAG: CHASE3 domain-containing protein [Chloroflexota bacterium]|nr:CHASE3 domain-containing protein [Chloroflexota bacterium]
MLPNLRLRWKFLLAFGAAIGLMLGQGATVYWSTIGDQKAIASVGQTHAVIDDAETARNALTAMSSAYVDFLLTGGEAFLETYAANRKTLLTELTSLQTEPADGSQAQRWRELLQRANSWDRETVQPGIAQRRALERQPGGTGVRTDAISSQLDQARVNAMQLLFTQAIAAERTRLDDRSRRMAEGDAQLMNVLAWGTGIAAGVGLLVAVLLARSIGAPITHLAAAACEIAGGNFGQRTGLRRRDEIGLLAESFDDMAEHVQSMVDDLESVVQAERDGQEQLRRQYDATVVESNVVNAILDSIADAVFAVDGRGHIARANEAAALMVGGEPGELVGKPAHQLLAWRDNAGRELDKDELPFHETMATGQTREVRGWLFEQPGGQQIPVAVRSTPVTDSQGLVIAAVQVVRDLRREQEVAQLKDNIISLVSHELRTPLTHIKGFASSLIDPEVSWDAATQREFITEIDQEADRLTALVADLLDMSKIEAAGTESLEKVRCSPGSIIDQALKAVRGVTTAHTIVNDVLPDLPDIMADAAAVQRVVSNLVENAAKYSEPGTEVRVTAHCTGDMLLCSVLDQGPGVPGAYRDRIFEKFFRLKTGRPRPPGTGLGLPICKGIVEAHGGRIWVESGESRGSRFCFTLPLEAARSGRS